MHKITEISSMAPLNRQMIFLVVHIYFIYGGARERPKSGARCDSVEDVTASRGGGSVIKLNARRKALRKTVAFTECT